MTVVLTGSSLLGRSLRVAVTTIVSWTAGTVGASPLTEDARSRKIRVLVRMSGV
jgi:hypothetical protein